MQCDEHVRRNEEEVDDEDNKEELITTEQNKRTLNRSPIKEANPRLATTKAKIQVSERPSQYQENKSDHQDYTDRKYLSQTNSYISWKGHGPCHRNLKEVFT